jgi:hypothetical protein
MPTQRLTAEILNAAIAGFEQQRIHIDSQIAELRATLDGNSAKPTAGTPGPPKRKVSAAARRRMALGQKARWAKLKGTSEPQTETVAARPKRKLSAAGRAAIVAALKKRWALKRAEAAKAVPKKKAVIKNTRRPLLQSRRKRVRRARKRQ